MLRRLDKKITLGAAPYCLVGVCLATLCAMLSMFSLYGSGHRDLNPSTDSIMLFVSNFLLAPYAVYLHIPVFYLTWGLIVALAYLQIKTVVSFFFVLLGGYAYWSTSKFLGHSLSRADVFPGLNYLIGDLASMDLIVLTLVLLPFLVLPGFILGLLFLPIRHRPRLLIASIAIPVAGFILLVLTANLFGDSLKPETRHPVTPLMLAAGDGTPEEVKSLIVKGIDINAKNIYGTNALMYAALAGRTENIKVLLAAGARVDDQDHKGNTALSLARQQGHQEAVALLVAAGAKEKSPPTR